MIRFLLRFLGLWILAAAFVSLVYDGMRSIAASSLIITQLRDMWTAIDQNSLTRLKPAIENHAWNPVIQAILNQPTSVVLGVLGSFLILLGRKKKPLIGYGRD
jgi:hypothetical protein